MIGGRLREGALLALMALLFWICVEIGGTLTTALSIFAILVWIGLAGVAVWLVLFAGAKPSVIKIVRDMSGRAKELAQKRIDPQEGENP